MKGSGNIPPGNGKTTSNPEPDQVEDSYIDFLCRDPKDPELPCPHCNGAGVYMLDVPLSDPRFGKFQRCPNFPVELDRGMQERLRRFGNLQAYRAKTFATFKTQPFGGSYAPGVIGAFKAAKAAARQYAEAPVGWLVYEGAHGSGKTHLAAAIANWRLEQYGERVVFLTAPDLLDFLRMTYNAEARFETHFEHIRDAPLLVLDDLGMENPSAWAKEKLFQLLNYRHVKQLPTVITTSRPLDELEPRLSSRLLDESVVQHIVLAVPDYRRATHSRRLELRFNNLEPYSQLTFANFRTDSAFPDEEANLKRVKKAAQSWADNPQNWLCLLGDYGSGKTHLAAAIANHLYEPGKDLKFANVPDLLDYFRETFAPQSQLRFDQRFHAILDTSILLLDDLRLASATAWAKEKLFQIIDYRYLRRLPTVITTVETPESIDQRIATRLLDQRLCSIYALAARSYVVRAPRPARQK